MEFDGKKTKNMGIIFKLLKMKNLSSQERVKSRVCRGIITSVGIQETFVQ